jgi:hypothetical protein
MEPAMASSTAAKDQRINEVIMHSPNSYDQAITGERKSCASTLALMVSLFALLFVSVLANAQCVPIACSMVAILNPATATPTLYQTKVTPS